MILKIVLLCLLIIVVSSLLFFLVYIFVPAVKKQTKVQENMIFSNIETSLFNVFHASENYRNPMKKAFVLCSCNKNFANDSQMYKTAGFSCSVVVSSKASVNDCKFSCIGLGDCQKVCPQGAIMIKNKTAVISSLCRGCGNCVNACPKNIIKLFPVKETIDTLCKNQDDTMTTCSEKEKNMQIQFPEQNYFKLWQSCYKIFNRKNK